MHGIIVRRGRFAALQQGKVGRAKSRSGASLPIPIWPVGPCVQSPDLAAVGPRGHDSHGPRFLVRPFDSGYPSMAAKSGSFRFLRFATAPYEIARLSCCPPQTCPTGLPLLLYRATLVILNDINEPRNPQRGSRRSATANTTARRWTGVLPPAFLRTAGSCRDHAAN